MNKENKEVKTIEPRKTKGARQRKSSNVLNTKVNPKSKRWTTTGIQNVVKVIMFFTSMVLYLSTLTIGKADFLLRLYGKDVISDSDVKQAGKS